MTLGSSTGGATTNINGGSGNININANGNTIKVGTSTDTVKIGGSGSTLSTGVIKCTGFPGGAGTAAIAPAGADVSGAFSMSCANAAVGSAVVCAPASAVPAPPYYAFVGGAGFVTVSYSNPGSMSVPIYGSYFGALTGTKFNVTTMNCMLVN